MNDRRIRAYQRLLYAAMLDFRSHNPYTRERFYWLRPWLWVRTRRRLDAIQETANWLHNLAFFATDDFNAFDEAWFWRDLDLLYKLHPQLRQRIEMRYRHEFETEWDEASKNRIKVKRVRFM